MTKTQNATTFLLDENIDVRIGSFLKRIGHTVIFGKKSMKNGELISLAKHHNAILITLDKDFTNTDLYPPSTTRGIVVLRIHPPKRDNLIFLLENLFATYPNHALLGKTYIVSREGIEIIDPERSK